MVRSPTRRVMVDDEEEEPLEGMNFSSKSQRVCSPYPWGHHSFWASAPEKRTVAVAVWVSSQSPEKWGGEEREEEEEEEEAEEEAELAGMTTSTSTGATEAAPFPFFPATGVTTSVPFPPFPPHRRRIASK